MDKQEERQAEKRADNRKDKRKDKRAFRVKYAVALLIFALWAAFLLTDLYRTKQSEAPLFAVPLIRYDNGSTDYYGLGYKIWKDANILNGETQYHITAWFVPKYISPGI